ncbi:MAG: DivIVA domain-containing protein [Actinobacteria bacterium]|nr:DivIVA domain-containing protein [Actinomycetota bacterium]
MSLTPVEIRHVKLGKRPLGYERKAVDRLLEDVTRSFEFVWRERADVRDEIERLEGELARYKELEVLLRNSLVAAERAAEDVRVQARREADVILEEARVRAREIAGGASDERERVKAEIRRLRSLETEVRAGYRAFLLTGLDRLEGETDERQVPEQAA